ncbi:unnamed protein product [Closterium sp. Yama58-4]|nr:unnamed protein product [Closterium sp. Yama58-4]
MALSGPSLSSTKLIQAAEEPYVLLYVTSTTAVGVTTPEKQEEKEDTKEDAGKEAEKDNVPRSITELVPLLMERAAEAFTKVVTSRAGGLIVLNVVTMLYATNTTIVKGAEEAAGGPLQFCLGRFAIAALALSPLLPAALANPAVRRCGIEMGLWTALAYLSQAFALITTGAGRVSFISTFTMIEVPLVAGLLGARIPPLVWAATASAVAGVLLLEANSEASTLVGDGLALVSAMAFGLLMVRSEHFAKTVPATASLDLIALQISTVACCAAIGTAFITLIDLPSATTALAADIGAQTPLPGFAAQAKDLISATSPTDALERLSLVAGSWPWVQMGYTGVVSTALCLWLEIVALRHVAASEVAMVYTLEPLYSALLASLVLQEEWTTVGYLGAALIFGGSAAVQLGNARDEKSESGIMEQPVAK